jgi:hypothetical protein
MPSAGWYAYCGVSKEAFSLRDLAAASFVFAWCASIPGLPYIEGVIVGRNYVVERANLLVGHFNFAADSKPITQ